MVSESRMLDAQYAVLGSMLIDERCIPSVIGKVQLSDFIDKTCRTVYMAIRNLFDLGKLIDPVTVVAALRSSMGDDLTQFVRGLMDITPTAAAVMEYVEIMKEGARLAELQSLSLALGAVHSLDEARELLDQANGLFVDRGKLRRMTMEQMMVDFYERHNQEHRYLTWGLPKVDKGLFAEAGDMIVIGGYPSSGKTALSVSFAYHMAKDLRVGFYSLETNQYKIADRMVSHISKLSMSVIKRGAFSEAEWDLVTKQHSEIPKRQLEIIEAGGMSVAEIRADALSHRFDCIVVDYLQLIQTNRRGTRSDEVAEISRSLHTMSQRDKITVIALSQLTRPEKTKGGSSVAPTMSDLRESGQIEQDADCVMLLYEEDPKEPERRVLKIAKNKEGKRGRILLDFDGSTQTFAEAASDGNGVASQYSEVGKTVKALHRATTNVDQVPMSEITGPDAGLPF